MNSLSGSLLGLFFVLLEAFLTIFGSLGPLWRSRGFIFWTQNQLAAPKVPQKAFSPFRTHPFGELLEHFFESVSYLFMKKYWFWKRCLLLLDFLVILSAPRDGLICNPCMPAQSKCTFSFSCFFSENELQKDLIWTPFWRHFWSKMWLLRKKRRSKNCFKKRCSAKVKRVSINMPGGSRRGSLACALYRQETVVRAAVEALFEIFAEKSGLGSKLVWKTDWIAESL